MFLLVEKKTGKKKKRKEKSEIHSPASPEELPRTAGLTRTMVNDGRCRRAGSFLLSPTLLGLGSGRFLCGWVTSCLGLLGFRAGFAAGLWTSAAVVLTGTPLAWLLVLAAFAALVLLVLLAVPHRPGARRSPAEGADRGFSPGGGGESPGGLEAGDGDDVTPSNQPGSEPCPEASVVLPCWSVSLFWTPLVLIAFASLQVTNSRNDSYDFV